MSTSNDQTSDGRRRYRAPELIEYGPVKDLTASGSGTQSENPPGRPPKKDKLKFP